MPGKGLNPGLCKLEPDSLNRRKKAESSSTDYFPPDSSKTPLTLSADSGWLRLMLTPGLRLKQQYPRPYIQYGFMRRRFVECDY